MARAVREHLRFAGTENSAIGDEDHCCHPENVKRNTVEHRLIPPVSLSSSSAFKECTMAE